MANQKTPSSLGVEGVGRLLLQYSLPAIVATAAASIYNIIDRIFIGHGVGPMAISGLALTFPLMNIVAAFGSLVGTGASVMVSIRLGQRDRKGATLILENALLLNIIIGLSIAIPALIFLDPILYAMGASDETLPYARQFMQVILSANVITHIYLGLNNIMRSSGYPKKAMITTLLTVAVNLALAPLFIFVFKWGIRGAAFATVCAQIVGTVWVVTHFFQKESFIHFLPGYFKLKRKIINDIFSIGMSNFLMFICASAVNILINLSLKKYGNDYAIGAFGIIISIANLIVMIILGFNQGMQPIAGYNYGAHQYSRVKRVYKLTVMAGSLVAIFGFLIAELFPRQIASAFTNSDTLINLAVNGMRLNFIMIFLVGFQMVTTNFFQSIGKAKIAIFLSLSRQVIFLIPALLILPHFLNLNGVWLSGPLSDLIASTVTFFVLQYQLKRLHLQEVKG